MDCQINTMDDVAEVVLIGSLDSSWAPYLSDRLDEVVRTGVREVRLDLSGVSYLSSNGIALLVRYHRQMRQIGGSFRIVEDSEPVDHVLRLTGLAAMLREDGANSGPSTSGPVSTSVTLERPGMTLQVFRKRRDMAVQRLQRIGDPTKLTPGAGGYGEDDDHEWRAVPDGVALGLGALGPDFEACRARYGEFLAVAGVAAYRPSGGPGRPDFEHAAGAFTPRVRVLYGLAFSTGPAPCLVRFEAKGEPLNRSVTLSQLADACLDQSGARTVGMVLVGETDGLVGTALRRSPVSIPEGIDPFAQPDAREWLSMTPEPEHARNTALVVGVATREPGPALAPFVRTLSETTAPGLLGHYHAAVVPFRPLPRGSFELKPAVQHLFEPGRVETVLHLLGDTRPIVGVGESMFTRGAFWFVELDGGE